MNNVDSVSSVMIFILVCIAKINCRLHIGVEGKQVLLQYCVISQSHVRESFVINLPGFHSIFFAVCKTTNQSTTSDTVFKYYVPNPNEKCVFPFTFDDIEYTKCTNYNCPECFWCGTQRMVKDNSGWGVCSVVCPKEEYGK